MEEVLKIENLHVSFDSYAGEVHAVRGVTLDVKEGEVLASCRRIRLRKECYRSDDYEVESHAACKN